MNQARSIGPQGKLLMQIRAFFMRGRKEDFYGFSEETGF